ncbi:MAG: DUF4965 domain-containing protein [Clostridia bacterium]|nr:DUF4965 domain-containing protein [Clostridia bacterium]NCC42094.1 DUF4965 domain-containing protein [Clostridia bacterium]
MSRETGRETTREKFAPRAVPLITADPHLNIWSFSDHLYDDAPRHWTGTRSALTGYLKMDGVWYGFMGKTELNSEKYFMEPEHLQQISVDITPTKTTYIFENGIVCLKLEFCSPLLLDDLKLMSRPVSFINYQVSVKDDSDTKAHKVGVYLDITSEAAVNSSDQRVRFGADANGIFCGRGEKDMLTKSGDDMRIDWGWLHLSAPDHRYMILNTEDKKRWVGRWTGQESRLPEFDKKIGTALGSEGIISENVELDQAVKEGYPALGAWKEYEVSVENKAEGMVCISYDDIHSIQYFGQNADAYWKKDGETFDEMLKAAVDGYGDVLERAAAFDEELKAEAMVYGQKYCDILSLAYRQTIAAHKLIEADGELLFFSKECYSNGCIGTVDVTYPSIPLYLKYCPQLVEGMINAIFYYVGTGRWPFEYAPHDVGQYPLANGQVYGLDRKINVLQEYYQMPVEECGNMLLSVAAICKAEGSHAYAEKHKEILTRWADYLVRIGWDPENQLCTDDFAGHLAHNCNLAIKGILGIAAWAQLLEQMGETDKAAGYFAKARELAVAWEKEAFAGDHYRLTFDSEESWSLKYNLVWDKMLGLDIFDEKIAKTEIAYYLTKMNPYGVPLDSRCDYTKSDWEMWTVTLSENEEYRRAIIDAMWDAVCDMDRRAPFPDWYHTEKAVAECFQNRTVQGGLFILLLHWGENSADE